MIINNAENEAFNLLIVNNLKIILQLSLHYRYVVYICIRMKFFHNRLVS